MPYQMYVTPDTISLNKILQGQGYTGYAMHPFPASNWNREEVFQDMGFAQFLSEPDFAGEEMIRDMCSDAGDYDPMTEQYRRALAGIDRMLARECDTVVELAAGRRIVHKGGLPF